MVPAFKVRNSFKRSGMDKVPIVLLLELCRSYEVDFSGGLLNKILYFQECLIENTLICKYYFNEKEFFLYLKWQHVHMLNDTLYIV